MPFMTSVLLAPYLPLHKTATIGRWTLLPILAAGSPDAVAEESAWIPESLRSPVRRLIDAYRVDDGPGLGALVAPPDGQVGAAFPSEDIRRLGHAILAGVLGANPELRKTEDNTLSARSLATSENAILYRHSITGGDSFAVVEAGVLLREQRAFSWPALPKVSPPVELPKPKQEIQCPDFDCELAAATWQVLNKAAGGTARRLSRALDWYRIALANAEVATREVRVVAARSALEVLLNAGSTKCLVRRYGCLMRAGGTEKMTCEVFWAKGPVQLTPDEWWMSRLCELRKRSSTATTFQTSSGSTRAGTT